MQYFEKIRIRGQRVGGQGQMGSGADGEFGFRRGIREKRENMTVY